MRIKNFDFWPHTKTIVNHVSYIQLKLSKQATCLHTGPATRDLNGATLKQRSEDDWQQLVLNDLVRNPSDSL